MITTPAGVVTTIMGQVGHTPPMPDIHSQLLNDPLGVAVNAAGTIVYLSECNNHTVSKIALAGGTWTRTVIAGQPTVAGHADSSTGVNALLNCPTGLALDEANNVLYVAEFGEHDIRKIALSGTFAISTIAGVPGTCGSQDSDGTNQPTFCNPYGITSDGSQSVGSTTLFVADSNFGTVRKIVLSNPFANTTTLAGTAGTHGTDATHLGRPMAVAYQNSSALYVTDQASGGTSGQMLRQIPLPAGGSMTTIAGVASTPGYNNGAGASALFNQPSGLAVLGSTAYLWDDANFVVRTVALTGSFNVATLAGSSPQSGTALQNGTGASSRFNQPLSLAADTAGAVYVADSANCALRKIAVTKSGSTYSAMVSTLAGGGSTTGKSCGTTDGAGATALFGPPQSLLFDGQHTLYVAERSLRSVDSSSAMATVSTTFSTPVQSQGVAIDGNGKYYVTSADLTINRFDPVTAELQRLWGQQNAPGSSDGFGEMASFSRPLALLLDGAGRDLYVSDAGGHTLRRISVNDAYVQTVAGSATASGAFADGVGTAAKLGGSDGLAWLPDGRIVFADTGAHAIRTFDPVSGQVTTLAGVLGVPGVKSGMLPGGVSAPHGVALLPTGELVVSDIGEQVVQIVY